MRVLTNKFSSSVFSASEVPGLVLSPEFHAIKYADYKFRKRRAPVSDCYCIGKNPVVRYWNLYDGMKKLDQYII